MSAARLQSSKRHNKNTALSSGESQQLNFFEFCHNDPLIQMLVLKRSVDIFYI